LTARDIVRHPLVSRIMRAYDRRENQIEISKADALADPSHAADRASG